MIKHQPNHLQNIHIGTRVTIHNSEYNDYKPFNGSVQFVPNSNIKVINPDIFLDHSMYKKNKQHYVVNKETFSILDDSLFDDDLFEV